MHTFLNIDWTAVLGVAGSMGLVAFMLLLVARMQLRRPSDRLRLRSHRWAIG